PFLYFPGVHAVLKTGNWVRYCIFDLATGKAEQENNFPTSNLAFLGQSECNVAIFTAGQKQTLMQHVLRCDYEACRQYLMNLEQAFLLDQGSQGLGALLGHRCDGNRNILHAAVSVCFPVSNKETKEEEDPFLMNVNDEAVCFSEAERSERNTFAERLSAVEAIANAISVVSSNSSGNRTGSSSSRG
ncbi:hypothetical protein GOODEAATRI_031859, partial [Goodea atripinnis]